MYYWLFSCVYIFLFLISKKGANLYIRRWCVLSNKSQRELYRLVVTARISFCFNNLIIFELRIQIKELICGKNHYNTALLLRMMMIVPSTHLRQSELKEGKSIGWCIVTWNLYLAILLFYIRALRIYSYTAKWWSIYFYIYFYIWDL